MAAGAAGLGFCSRAPAALKMLIPGRVVGEIRGPYAAPRGENAPQDSPNLPRLRGCFGARFLPLPKDASPVLQHTVTSRHVAAAVTAAGRAAGFSPSALSMHPGSVFMLILPK